MAKGSGTAEKPWILKTPPGTAEFEAYRDPKADPPALVVQVGQDPAPLPASLRRRPARDAEEARRLDAARQRRRTEAGGRRHRRGLGRAESNPVSGWYGLKKGLRGRFGMYVPPVLEALGLVEVEHNPKNNRIKALKK